MSSLLEQVLAHPDVVRPPNSKGEASAWCPWHPDKAGGKPSLGINVRKQMVKCWSCGKGGLRKLAEAWGIAVEDAGPQGRPLAATYDYRDGAGRLLFQVVRFPVSAGEPKRIAQRRPDPGARDGWAWNLKGVERVLYRLPQLAEAPDEQWVFVVEGEKDADRLAEAGLVVTTNPGGAGKFYRKYSAALAGRRVAIIPDNDAAGRAHAEKVAEVLHGVAGTVRVIELAGVPEDGGDVSDWLDAGGDPGELRALAEGAPVHVPPEPGDPGEELTHTWPPSRHRAPATAIMGEMQRSGYFVHAQDAGYYFHQTTKTLIPLSPDDITLLTFLSDQFRLNPQDDLFRYLLKEMVIESRGRASEAQVARFSHYDRDANVVYLDMGEGRVLRIDGSAIAYRDNGVDGILFVPNRRFRPWKYSPNGHGDILVEKLIAPLRFDDGEDATHDPDEASHLLLAWILSLAFESLQPTKPLALAIGPSGSGKSNLFRRVGRLLFGSDFEVNKANRDKEIDFWNIITNRPFACFDNVDTRVPWLEEALATASTGVEFSTRTLYTTNDVSSHTPRCFLALTARTPRFRREDVASRLLIFRLGRLEAKRREREILDEVEDLRDELMSNYVQLIRRIVSTPYSEPVHIDPSIRLADFAGLASWIAEGLGGERFAPIVSAINKLKSSQHAYATEDSDLVMLIEEWIDHEQEGAMPGTRPNEGRHVGTTELYRELKRTADSIGMAFPIRSAKSLGRQLQMLEESLSARLNVGHHRSKHTRAWSFTRIEGP